MPLLLNFESVSVHTSSVFVRTRFQELVFFSCFAIQIFVPFKIDWELQWMHRIISNSLASCSLKSLTSIFLVNSFSLCLYLAVRFRGSRFLLQGIKIQKLYVHTLLKIKIYLIWTKSGISWCEIQKDFINSFLAEKETSTFYCNCLSDYKA
jgi:hypothetical protein